MGNFEVDSINFELNGPYAWAFQNEDGGNCELMTINQVNNTYTFTNFSDCAACGGFGNTELGDASFINGSWAITYACDGDIHMLVDAADYELGYDVEVYTAGLIFPNYNNASATVIQTNPTGGNQPGELGLYYVGKASAQNGEDIWAYCGIAFKLNNWYALIANCSTPNTTQIGVWDINTEAYVSTPINVLLGNITSIAPIGVTFAGTVPTIAEYLITVANWASPNMAAYSIYSVSPTGTFAPYYVPTSVGTVMGSNFSMVYPVHNNEVYFVSANNNFAQVSVYNVTANAIASGTILTLSGLVAMLLMIFTL